MTAMAQGTALAPVWTGAAGYSRDAAALGCVPIGFVSPNPTGCPSRQMAPTAGQEARGDVWLEILRSKSAPTDAVSVWWIIATHSTDPITKSESALGGLAAPGRIPDKLERLRALHLIAERCAARPTLDERPADELVGYDENGLPS